MSLGFSEIMMICVVALLVFGPEKLPDLAKTVGRALREFRRAQSELQHTVRETFEHLEEGSVPDTSLRDLYQRLDPRAIIQDTVMAPFAQAPPSAESRSPASTEGLSLRPDAEGEAVSMEGDAPPSEGEVVPFEVERTYPAFAAEAPDSERAVAESERQGGQVVPETEKQVSKPPE